MKQYNIDRIENGRKAMQNFPAVNCFFKNFAKAKSLTKQSAWWYTVPIKKKNIFSLENTVSQVKKEEKV